jgi:lactose/L-arabinose transport system permease protein
MTVPAHQPSSGAVELRPGARVWRRRRRGLRSQWAPYGFITPFFVVFLAFGVYPLIYALRLSFTDWHGVGPWHSVGLGNYSFLLGSSVFWDSVGRSGEIWLMVVPFEAVLALALAVVLMNGRLRGRGLFRAAIVVPFITPVVAMAEVWLVLFDQNNGAVNSVLSAFGLPKVGWLTTTAWAKPTIGLLVFWRTLGLGVIIMLAGLQSIPVEVHEAARVDGATPRKELLKVTIPLMTRSIAFFVITGTLYIFQMFAEPYLVTQGGPYGSTTTAGVYLYSNITNYDLGTGAANSFILVALVLAVSMVFLRLLRPRS